MARKRKSPPFMLKSQGAVSQYGFRGMGSSPLHQNKIDYSNEDTMPKSSNTESFEYTHDKAYDQSENISTSSKKKKTDEEMDAGGGHTDATTGGAKVTAYVLDQASKKTQRKVTQKIATKTGAKIAAKIGSRFLGPVGVGLAVYDVADFGYQVYKKGLSKAWNESLVGSTLNSLFSDERLKENVYRTGTSKSGIPTYEFNYKNDTQKWEGAMAQDLLDLGRGDSVSVMENGYFGVDYNKIDVNMTKV